MCAVAYNSSIHCIVLGAWHSFVAWGPFHDSQSAFYYYSFVCAIFILRLDFKCGCNVLVVGLVDFLSLFVSRIRTSRAGIFYHQQQRQHILYQDHCQHHVLSLSASTTYPSPLYIKPHILPLSACMYFPSLHLPTHPCWWRGVACWSAIPFHNYYCRSV